MNINKHEFGLIKKAIKSIIYFEETMAKEVRWILCRHPNCTDKVCKAIVLRASRRHTRMAEKYKIILKKLK